jgi:hypothetical protein
VVAVVVGTVVAVVVGTVVVVVVVVVVVQVGTVMVFVSSVTAPFRAITRPTTVAPVSSVADVNERMVPANTVLVPRVVELPTCQNTLQAWAPPVSWTVLPDPVVRVDPAWKMKTAFGLPCPSRVTVPVRAIEDADLYTPGAKVWPPRSLVTVVAGVRPAASLYAVVRSDWACCAVESATYSVPWTTPGGKPVTEVPG